MMLELFALCVSLYILFKFFHPICGGEDYKIFGIDTGIPNCNKCIKDRECK